MSTRVLQVDVAEPLLDHQGFDGYQHARILIRYLGHVVGDVTIPVEGDVLAAARIRAATSQDSGVRERLARAVIDRYIAAPAAPAALPSWSVVVCTHDRAEVLGYCLESLVVASNGVGEIIVVDNAPSSDAAKDVVERYPGILYVREDRLGLNRARARGAQAASGEIVIFTDDDTIADPGWIAGLVAEFTGSRVGAVTGLTMPYELETDAQELFEKHGGFSRGLERREFQSPRLAPADAGAAGAGASMAFRRDLVLSMGLFDAELDAGTRARSGGDTYAFSRLLNAGYRIVYTPDALNWHRHRRERAELVDQVSGYGVGMYSVWTKLVVEHRDMQALRSALRWLRSHHLKGLARALLRRPSRLPMDMVTSEMKGMIRGPFTYLAGRRGARRRAEAEVTAS